MSTTCSNESFPCAEGERGLRHWATSASPALTRERIRFWHKQASCSGSRCWRFLAPATRFRLSLLSGDAGCVSSFLVSVLGVLGSTAVEPGGLGSTRPRRDTAPSPDPLGPICTSGADRRGPWEAFSSLAEERQQEKMRGIAYRPFGNTQDPSPRVIRAVRTG